MASVVPPPFATLPVAVRDRYSFTVADYHQLIAAGSFKRSDRIELINGELTLMPPIGPEHSSHTRRLTNLLPRKLPKSVMLQMNEPITIPKHSEPQPDAAIVRAKADNYKSGHPQPKDVLLVIEVADSSAAFDYQVKSKLYGKAGIAEYWILNIEEGCLRVFTEPSSKGYRTAKDYYAGDRVQCGTVAELDLRVDELFV